MTTLETSIAIDQQAANTPPPPVWRGPNRKHDYHDRVINFVRANGASSRSQIHKATGIPNGTLSGLLRQLEGEGEIYLGLDSHRRPVWRIGISPRLRDIHERAYGIKTQPGKDGRTVIKFGDQWRAGRAQTCTPRGLGGTSSIYYE